MAAISAAHRGESRHHRVGAPYESEIASADSTRPSGEVAGAALAWRGFQQWRLPQGTTLFGDRAASAESAAAWRVQRARRLALSSARADARSKISDGKAREFHVPADPLR